MFKPSWYLIGKPRTLSVTSKLATEFMEMEGAHVDRPLSEKRVQAYKKAVLDGRFRPVTWAKAFCEAKNAIYRVDGKHTSTLFATMIENIQSYNLSAIITEYHCPTLEDVADLYSTFDSHLQSRTASDINRSCAAIDPQLMNLDIPFLNLVVSALDMDKSFGSWGKRPRAERAEDLWENVDIVLWTKDILKCKSEPTKKLWRVPVVAAMIGTYRKNKQQADIFWSSVRDEIGPTPHCADRVLARFLTQTHATKSHVHNVKKITDREYLAKCIHAWNAWRKNQVLAGNLSYNKNNDLPTIK